MGLVSRVSRFKERMTANGCILFDSRRPVEQNAVNLHWWSAVDDMGASGENVGDGLSPVVVDWMLRQRGIVPSDPVRSTRHLAALGSVIGIGTQNCTIWGSGCWGPGPRSWKTKWWLKRSNYDIRAVRGPETRKLLEECGHSCPEVFGDPAVLMPLVFQPPVTESTGVVFIPHMSDSPTTNEPVTVLSTLDSDWRHFITVLANADKVLSSSLHGIILAEAYGVPAVWVDPSGLGISHIKYADWYLSTGRVAPVPAKSVSEALKIDESAPPSLESMRQTLLSSFPYDLWTA